MSAQSALLIRGRRMGLSALLLSCTFAPLLSSAQDYSQQSPYAQQLPQQPGYDQPQGDPSQMDPPSRVARVSVVQGNVSLQPSGVEDFSPASLNYPLTSGDRLYSDAGAVAELEVGGLAIRLGSATDLSVTSMTDQIAQFGLGQGSVHVRSYDFDPNSTLEIDTPNVAVTVLSQGDVRVDVTPDGTMTQVTLLAGQARVDGPGFQQQLQQGESVQLTGSEQVYAQDVRRARPDSLDGFSQQRDSAYQNAMVTQTDYINADTIGAADLGQYGDWSDDSDYGAVWYPRGVAVDWQPYSVGHWAYIAPWGWTWVEGEPWGFAPFHYGRWARFGPRWGWIPGPRVVRPVYSPALVAFVGGGTGVTAWFPLGPREPYTPWYRTSSLYANRVNVSNIYSRNNVEVRNIYNQRTTNVYVNNTVINRTYVNRQVATVAVPQNTFAGGRPVHEAAMRVPPQQLANAPVLAHPNASPTRQIMTPAPARALPPRINRPPVESRAPMFQPGGAARDGGRRDPNGFGGANRFPNGGNRPGGFGNQGGAPDSSVPANSNPREPAAESQHPIGGQQPGRNNTPLDPQTGRPQGPPSAHLPNQQPGQYAPSSPSGAPGSFRPGSAQPGSSQPSSTQQPGFSRPGSTQPGIGQPQPTQPGATQPGSGTPYPNRGAQWNPGTRGTPQGSGTATPAAPANPGQQPNRGNFDNQGSQRGAPGQYPITTSVPPVQQPARGNPPQAPSDLNVPARAVRAPIVPDQRLQGPAQAPRPQPSANPMIPQSEPPARDARQGQQPNNYVPQNRPQPPVQTPRVQPQPVAPRVPPPQPQHQVAPQPAPRQATPPPAQNTRSAHDDDKKH